MKKDPFWKQLTLAQMNREQWESLCDGCAKCCLFKLEDEETAEVQYTNVCCRLLNIGTCRCTSYSNRNRLVPGCSNLTPAHVALYHWLPKSCAYRLLHEGNDLPSWHHLICGDRNAVHKQGHSVRGRVVSENLANTDDLDRYVTDWD